MKVVFTLTAVAICTGCTPTLPRDYQPKEGDVVFQSLPHCDLVDAIEGCTKCPYSHCGIVAQAGERWVVIEAIGNVRETPIEYWVARGRNGAFCVYQWSDALQPKVPEIVAAAREYIGEPYDYHYAFDNDAIYCSELIYLSCRDVTGKPIGNPQELRDMDWKPFEQVIREIEGSDVPLDRQIISPRALTEAPELSERYCRGYARKDGAVTAKK